MDDFQKLCELADKELNLGLADARLIERALAEANGVDAHARQIYWRLRAKALRQKAEITGDDTEIVELQTLIQIQEKRIHNRKERYRWFWAGAYLASILGTVVFPILAHMSYQRNERGFYAYVFLGVAPLVSIILTYNASKYHLHTD